jgi:hypothetical protein
MIARKRSILQAVLAGAAALTCLNPATAWATDQVFTGYARDLESRRLLYIESHFVRAAGTVGEQRVVLYRCSNGTDSFARKELEYGAAREEPQFTLLDARSGYTEGLRRTAQGLEVFQRATANAPVRRAKVPTNVAIVSDAGFDEFVRKHWAELEAGRTVRFPFLVPSRLDFLTFKVKKHHEESIESATASVIRLNLSGVLGWFLPYIEVSYRKSDRVLMRYKGLTNVRDSAGNNLVAQIDFPARERQPAPAVDLAAQRAVKLVSRCPG